MLPYTSAWDVCARLFCSEDATHAALETCKYSELTVAKLPEVLNSSQPVSRDVAFYDAEIFQQMVPWYVLEANSLRRARLVSHTVTKHNWARPPCMQLASQ